MRELLAGGGIDLITFTSSSTVLNMLALLGEDGGELLNKAAVACIGPVTAMTCRDHSIRRDIIAEEFTVSGLVESIKRHYQEGLA